MPTQQPTTTPAPKPATPDAPTIADLTGLLGLGPDATMAEVLRVVLDLLKDAGGAKEAAALMSELVPATAPDPARFGLWKRSGPCCLSVISRWPLCPSRARAKRSRMPWRVAICPQP